MMLVNGEGVEAMTMRAILVCIGASCLLPVTALADGANQKPKRQTTLELSPYLAFTGSDLPGPIGGGIGAEVALTSNWSVSGMFGFAQLRRSQAKVERAQAANPDTGLVEKRLTGYSFLGSGRYYFSPLTNSWFAGGGFGVGRGTADYAAGSEQVSDNFAGGFFTAEGGYRWLWDNRLSFRLTGRGYSKAITKDDFAPGKSDDGPRDVSRKTRSREITGIVPSLNFGVGYSF